MPLVRRRIYLMRHGAVSYFENGRPLQPHTVPLTDEGRAQARAAAAALAGVTFDRVVTSGLPRAVETARIVAPSAEPESWPELREIESGRLADLPDPEAAFQRAFHGVVPEDTVFLGGETIGALLDRVLPAISELLADESWDTLLAVLHGAVNRAILSHALTGERMFLGNFEQAPGCINVLDVGADWIVRAVNVTPYDLIHMHGRTTTMEELWQQFQSM
jgi:broad specificity phosphatase PhoE